MRVLDLILKLDTDTRAGDIVEIDGVSFEIYEKAADLNYIRRAPTPAFDAATFRFAFLMGVMTALAVYLDYLFSEKHVPASQISSLMAGCIAIGIGSWVVVGFGTLAVRFVMRRFRK